MNFRVLESPGNLFLKKGTNPDKAHQNSTLSRKLHYKPGQVNHLL